MLTEIQTAIPLLTLKMHAQLINGLSKVNTNGKSHFYKPFQSAGLNEICEGKKRINIAPEGEKTKYRSVLGKFPKWQLVSSHIGRRSFATNYYGKVPISHLINITGHGSEKMFLNYIKKSNMDMALDAYAYFD